MEADGWWGLFWALDQPVKKPLLNACVSRTLSSSTLPEANQVVHCLRPEEAMKRETEGHDAARYGSRRVSSQHVSALHGDNNAAAVNGCTGNRVFLNHG